MSARHSDIAERIWDLKYRHRQDDSPVDAAPEDTWQRVASALASPEPEDRAYWQHRFFDVMADQRFLPGGRIIAGAGTEKRVTLFNCFVMGRIEDTMDGIFHALKETAITLQQGGGIGQDFSTLRPAGSHTRSAAGEATGPVSFMRIWDSTCATLLASRSRRGAMMATLRCDHPDIETFVTAKAEPGELRHFNLSVLVTDAFMQAVADDEDWPLVFPRGVGEDHGETLQRHWPGHEGPVPCRVWRRLPARRLWQKIMESSFDHAEPGVLFVDTINRDNNLWYTEHISATNPCGEIPLPPYGACDLGSINLTRFVLDPFSPRAHLDLDGIRHTARVAMRMLDNVIDVSRFPLPAQEERARATRRTGLGITGLADALMMLGLDYGHQAARQQAAGVMETICHAAYRTSVQLAREKGPFPEFDRDRHLRGPFIQALPADIREGIAEWGIRNSHLLAIAPTGSISLLAGNVSGGVEPVFSPRHRRRLHQRDGSEDTIELTDYAIRLWEAMTGNSDPPPAFREARALSPIEHLEMEAALQPFVDNSISKTINIPGDFAFDDYQDVYRRAFELGLKGCTTFRPNPVTGAILERDEPETAACCAPRT